MTISSLSVSLPLPAHAWWLAMLLLSAAAAQADPADPTLDAAARKVRAELAARCGPGEDARIERGLAQVLRHWRKEDGDEAALRRLALEQFAPTGAALDATFDRFEYVLERQDGYLVSLGRDLKRGVDVEVGPRLPLDDLLGAYDPAAHVLEDAFQSKLAFAALLNFPETTLEERLAEGPKWTRRQWAEVRLAGRYSTRMPAEAQQAMARALAGAEAYISAYNIQLHHVLTPDGQRLFPPGLRLISHWNLRDELKARYADPDGLPKQRLIALVMDRIIRQEIPEAVIDNPLLDWTPDDGKVQVSPIKDLAPRPGAARAPATSREPDVRYRRWLDVFHAARIADRYDPLNPTFIDRSFRREREILETQVKTMLEAVLASPLGPQVGREISRRLGRPLQPFDIWYAGFRPRPQMDDAQLDRVTQQRYPTADAFARDLPRILGALGFSPEQVRFLAERIVVDPSRGAGHALGAARRDDQAHLRTRVGPGGMDYKGYNIAIHELGHNCEQVFSNSAINHTLLRGVPNNAFTEAMAFLFQARDLELLGQAPANESSRALSDLDQFWAEREIAGVALVDMAAWRWLYSHPDADPAQLKDAVVRIAQEVWNQHFAPIFNQRDVPLLAIYSHLVEYPLYTPDYALGQLIAFQVAEHFRKTQGSSFGAEFERVTKLGSVTPEAWMRQAVGGPLASQPLLDAAAAALASTKH